MKLYRLSILAFALFSIFDLLINFNNYFDLFNRQFISPKSSLYEFGQWNIRSILDYSFIFYIQFIGLIFSYFCISINKFFKFFSFTAWLLLISLFYVNPLALNQFDFLRISFSFFIFLIGSPTSDKNKLSVLSFNLFVCSIYFLQYLNRPISDWLGSGTTVFYILSNINNWTPLSSFILNSLEIHKIISYSIFIIELFIPMIVLFYYGKYRNKLLLLSIVHHLITYFIINNRPEQLLMICFLMPLFLGNEKVKNQHTIITNSLTLIIMTLILTSSFKGKSWRFFEFSRNAIGLRSDLSFYHFKKEDHWYRIFAVTKENKHLDLLDNNETDYFDNMIPASSSKFLTNGQWHRFLTKIDNKNEEFIKIQNNIISFYCSTNLYKEVSLIKISKKIRTEYSEKIEANEKIILKKECLN